MLEQLHVVPAAQRNGLGLAGYVPLSNVLIDMRSETPQARLSMLYLALCVHVGYL